MGYSLARRKLIHEKNLNSKIPCQTPSKALVSNDRKKVYIEELLDKKKMLTYGSRVKGAV
jgi:hypothetical protein